MNGWQSANLSEREQALCTFAEKLTHKPASMTPADLDVLREHGLDDRDLPDATQVIGYFNYLNRVADALGTDLEPEMPARPAEWGR